jgi:hypothetical protein
MSDHVAMDFISDNRLLTLALYFPYSSIHIIKR